MLHGRLRDIRRLVLISHGEYFYALLLSVDLQLLNGCRTIHIAGGKQCLLALGFELASNLRRGCCLTCTLETNHHNDCQLLTRTKCNLRCLRSHETNHLFVDDLDYHLPRVEATHHILPDCSLLHILDELLYHSEVDIRFKKSHLNFLQRSLDIILSQSALAAQVLKYVLQFFRKTVKCHPTAPLISDLISLQSVPSISRP